MYVNDPLSRRSWRRGLRLRTILHDTQSSVQRVYLLLNVCFSISDLIGKSADSSLEKFVEFRSRDWIRQCGRDHRHRR